MLKKLVIKKVVKDLLYNSDNLTFRAGYFNMLFREKNFFLTSVFDYNKVLYSNSKKRAAVEFKELCFFFSTILFIYRDFSLVILNISNLSLLDKNLTFFFKKKMFFFFKKFNFFFINFKPKKIKSIKKNLKKKIKLNHNYFFF